MQRNMSLIGRWVAVGWMLSLGSAWASVPGGVWEHGLAEQPGGALTVFATSTAVRQASLWTVAATSAVPGSALIWPDRVETAAGGASSVYVHQVALQPGAAGRFCVARWLAPTAGTYAIEASILNQQADPNHALVVQVLLRGKPCFDQVLKGGLPEQKIRLAAELESNDSVVFAVGGSGDGDASESALLTVALGAVVGGQSAVTTNSVALQAEVLAATNTCRVYYECFSTGLSGWAVTPPVTGGSVFWSGADIQADFEELTVPMPESVRIAAGRAASAGQFVGDWDAAGIDQISFDFQAAGGIPSWVQLRIHDGTRYAFKGLAVTTTNTWQHFAVSVEDMNDGGWNGGLSPADFATLRTNVVEVSLLIMRSGLAAQTYRIDNFSLDRVQRAMQLGGAAETTSFTWAHLLAQRSYRVEAIADPGSTNWVEVASMIATDSVSSVVVPLTNQTGFLRLVQR